MILHLWHPNAATGNQQHVDINIIIRNLPTSNAVFDAGFEASTLASLGVGLEDALEAS